MGWRKSSGHRSQRSVPAAFAIVAQSQRKTDLSTAGAASTIESNIDLMLVIAST
jgi:hypothetical protein